MSLFNKLIRWFDAYAVNDTPISGNPDHIDGFRILPFILMHVACLLIFVVGWSPVAVLLAVLFYGLRMFAITGFYHRYFSHRSFKTGRIAQFLFAFAGGTAVQRGALWWAGHHRIHHRIADTPEDPHSPAHRGFLYSHMLWFLTDENSRTRLDKVKDWRKFPELVWLDRFHIVPPVVFAVFVLLLGYWLETFDALHTSAWQVFVWGFIVSTVALYHGTYTINSLSHLYGSRRYNTSDTSRNNAILALVTLGEGWHNNHHRYAVSTRQGFFPHEIDITYWGIRFLETLGIVHDLRPVPESVLAEAHTHGSDRSTGSGTKGTAS